MYVPQCQFCMPVDVNAPKRQDLPCMYLAHHEPASVNFIIIITIIIILIGTVAAAAAAAAADHNSNNRNNRT